MIIIQGREDLVGERMGGLNKIMQFEPLKDELERIGGKGVFKVLKLLEKTGDDERIAQHLKVKVSDVRSILNKLNQAGIITYERTRDKETGWYYYSWVFSPEKVLEWYNKKIESRLSYLQSLIAEGEYYYCKKCSVDSPVKFEEAMDYDFVCPVHNTKLELIDFSIIEKLKRTNLKLLNAQTINKKTSKANKAKKKNNRSGKRKD
jgi:transcription initiation factor TFIIE subunit alpha